jgi:hypothetical protein
MNIIRNRILVTMVIAIITNWDFFLLLTEGKSIILSHNFMDHRLGIFSTSAQVVGIFMGFLLWSVTRSRGVLKLLEYLSIFVIAMVPISPAFAIGVTKMLSGFSLPKGIILLCVGLVIGSRVVAVLLGAIASNRIFARTPGTRKIG